LSNNQRPFNIKTGTFWAIFWFISGVGNFFGQRAVLKKISVPLGHTFDKQRAEKLFFS